MEVSEKRFFELCISKDDEVERKKRKLQQDDVEPVLLDLLGQDALTDSQKEIMRACLRQYRNLKKNRTRVELAAEIGKASDEVRFTGNNASKKRKSTDLSEYSSPRKPFRELLDYPNMNLTLTLNVFLNSIYLGFVLLIPF